MIFARASIVTFVLSALSVKAAYFNPLHPSVVIQCDTIQLSYKGCAPFVISAWKGCDDDAETDVPEAQYHTNLTTVNWKVNFAAGKSVMFGVEDSKGDWEWSEDYVVHESNDSSCLGKKPSFSSPGSENPTSTTTTTTTSTTTTTTQPPGNAGAPPGTTPDTATTTPAHHIGGIGGALSNFSPRVELVVLVTGSSLASLFF